jgi:hypothetical protein
MQPLEFSGINHFVMPLYVHKGIGLCHAFVSTNTCNAEAQSENA